MPTDFQETKVYDFILEINILFGTSCLKKTKVGSLKGKDLLLRGRWIIFSAFKGKQSLLKTENQYEKKQKKWFSSYIEIGKVTKAPIFK